MAHLRPFFERWAIVSLEVLCENTTIFWNIDKNKKIINSIRWIELSQKTNFNSSENLCPCIQGTKYSYIKGSDWISGDASGHHFETFVEKVNNANLQPCVKVHRGSSLSISPAGQITSTLCFASLLCQCTQKLGKAQCTFTRERKVKSVPRQEMKTKILISII